MPPVSSNKSQPEYPNNVKVGEMVHFKCVHVTAEAQCKCRRKNGCWGCSKKASQKAKPTQTKYNLLDRSTKLVPLQDIHCGPGKWIDMMPVAPLFRVDMPEQDHGSTDMLKPQSIQQSDDLSLDESQSICELFPDFEPVPAPVLEEQVPAEQAVEEQVKSGDDSDNESDVKPSTDNIHWYTEMNNINGLINPMEWSFKDEMGEDMSDDRR
jgi:hypothetical protein